MVTQRAVELGELAELGLLVVVCVVLARGDDVHDLPLARIDALLSVDALRGDDDMQRFGVFRGGWATRAAVFHGTFAADGDLATEVFLEAFLGVSSWTEDETDEV